MIRLQVTLAKNGFASEMCGQLAMVSPGRECLANALDVRYCTLTSTAHVELTSLMFWFVLVFGVDGAFVF